MKDMRIKSFLGMVMVAGLLFWSAPGVASFAAEDDDKILARIDDAVITQAEFNRELESLHMTMLESKDDTVSAPAIDFPGVMQRLINLRLLAMEARSIGLDQQPEFRKNIDQYRTQQLKQLVLGEVVRDNPVTVEDEEVQDLYQRLSRELRMISMLFEKQQAAEKAKQEIEEKGFESVAREMQSRNDVEVSLEEDFIPLKDLLPFIGRIAIDMEVGDVSPIFRPAEGYMIFQLAEVKQVEDEDVLQQALDMVKEKRHKQAKTEFLEGLVEKYVEIDEEVLSEIDYSASGPPLDELKSDERVVATIGVPGQEQETITVADLTEIMADKYYHGLEQARKSNDLNVEKDTILRKRLMSRLLLAEAKRRGIDESPEFQAMMDDYENRMLFAEMVRKVIGPDVTFTEEQVEAYYEENKDEYSTPRMVRMSSVPFSGQEYAEQSAEMLRKGADFAWIRKNAPGQVQSDEAELTRMNKKIVTMTGMPDDVRAVVKDLSAGQAGWYRDDNDYYQVVYVDEVIPEEARPLEDVRTDVEKSVFRQNVTRAVNEYAEQARKHYVVEIYDPELRREQGLWQQIKSFFN